MTYRHRVGFTLVELLVAMSVIVALATIALVIAPDVMNRDRTTDGASTVRQALQISKARARRDNLPRGIRLLTGLDSTNPAKTNPLWATELQYIERPPPLLPNTGRTDPQAPRVDIVFELNSDNSLKVPGSCFLMNLPNDVRDLINSDVAVGVKPELSVPTSDDHFPYFRIPVTSSLMSVTTGTRIGAQNYVVSLDTAFPIEILGAAEQKSFYQFSVSLAVRPLLGEPSVPLPSDICVDLVSSSPSGTTDYDIVFAPNGQIIGRGDGQINLWVRDYTKNGGSGGSMEQGGEQQVVSLKTRSGSLGVFPISWTAGNPFEFATKAASTP